MASLLITMNNLPDYDQYVVAWFVNVATHQLLNMSIYELVGAVQTHKAEILEELYRKATDFIKKLADIFKKEDICSLEPPIPLTPNDRTELFNPCKALEFLSDASRGKIYRFPLQPALSFEFAEYVRTYMPTLKTSTLKREVVAVTSEVLALLVLGAYASRVYVVEGEYGYTFIGTYNPRIADIEKLNTMARMITKAVVGGDGSRIALLVGLASATVLNVGKYLFEVDGRTFYSSIRIVRTGNKTMLKAYETIDLTDLSQTIMRLQVASAIYNLVSNYPSRDLSKTNKYARTARSVIEELARAIYKYYLYEDPAELYRALRTATTRTTLSDLVSYLTSKGRNASDIINELLNVRV
ncbi:MAG: hypothetical protein QXT64_00335 [Desulfurococcaceae archaeon]